MDTLLIAGVQDYIAKKYSDLFMRNLMNPTVLDEALSLDMNAPMRTVVIDAQLVNYAIAYDEVFHVQDVPGAAVVLAGDEQAPPHVLDRFLGTLLSRFETRLREQQPQPFPQINRIYLIRPENREASALASLFMYALESGGETTDDQAQLTKRHLDRVVESNLFRFTDIMSRLNALCLNTDGYYTPVATKDGDTGDGEADAYDEADDDDSAEAADED